MRRRRHATIDELAELLAGTRAADKVAPATIRKVLDGLAELGAPVDALAQVYADEPLPTV